MNSTKQAPQSSRTISATPISDEPEHWFYSARMALLQTLMVPARTRTSAPITARLDSEGEE